MHLYMEKSKHNFVIRFWNEPMQKDRISTTETNKKFDLLSVPYYYAEVIDKILTINEIR